MKVGTKWAESGRYAHFDMVETWSVARLARAAPGRGAVARPVGGAVETT
jgi:hypothetical protein